MASIDTLGYAKHLQGAGIEARHAEAHAEAARDFIMTDLVTKADLKTALDAQTDKMTIRLGMMLAGVAGIVFAAIRFLPQ